METQVEFEDPELKWSGKVWKIERVDPQPPDPNYKPQPGAFKIYTGSKIKKANRHKGRGTAPDAIDRVKQRKEQEHGEIFNG